MRPQAIKRLSLKFETGATPVLRGLRPGEERHTPQATPSDGRLLADTLAWSL